MPALRLEVGDAEQKTVLVRPIKLGILLLFFGFYCFDTSRCRCKPRHPFQDWIARNNQDFGLRFEGTGDRKRNLYLSRLHPGRGGASQAIFTCLSINIPYPFKSVSISHLSKMIQQKSLQMSNRRTASSIFQLCLKKTRGKHIGRKCQEAHTFWAVIVKTAVPS